MVTWPAQAAPPKVVVEITPKAQKRLDAQLARRLIKIELGDIDVPPRPTDPYPQAMSTVFFRVLVPAPDRLHVELWDRGDFYGARRVSVTGSARLRSRRIALGAAELAWRLRQRRLVQARRIEQEEQRALAAEQQAERERRLQGVTLTAGAKGAFVSSAGWLAGPELSGGYRFLGGSRAALSLGAYTGQASDIDGSPGWRWLEAGLRGGHGFRLGEQTDLAVGAEVAAAAVRVTEVPSVDGVSGQSDTWSARAGLNLRFEQRVGSKAFLAMGPDLGVALRPVPVVDALGDKQSLGGVWLGLGAELALSP